VQAVGVVSRSHEQRSSSISPHTVEPDQRWCRFSNKFGEHHIELFDLCVEVLDASGKATHCYGHVLRGVTRGARVLGLGHLELAAGSVLPGWSSGGVSVRLS
jgi:hypothetical protein